MQAEIHRIETCIFPLELLKKNDEDYKQVLDGKVKVQQDSVYRL